MDKKIASKKNITIISSVIIFCVIGLLAYIIFKEPNNKKEEEMQKELTSNYNIDLIKKFHEFNNDKNLLISPYNIEIALNMLRDGSLGKTKEELDNLLGNRKINDLQVKNQIGIANGVFIKNEYKNSVKSSYYNILKTKYNSDIIYDEFITPDKINNWVKEKTNDMIDKILDSIDKDYVMGLASALAIDVKWLSSFDCSNTRGEEFTKLNNEKINTEMMHQTFKTNAYKYISTTDAEGIIIPYMTEDNSHIELEFVGILPNNGINNFVNGLSKNSLDTLLNSTREASDKVHLNVSLPRFKYDYNADQFIDILKALGIKNAFDPDKADFKEMIEISENVYVGEAIHKTYIELNEVGTKAAAITYFGMFKNSAIIEKNYEEININFNKPFVYMIREKNTGEILFFGEVIEPTIWNGSTCDN